MAFPTTGILDDFNRADSPLPTLSSWTANIYQGSNDFLEIFGNQCRCGQLAFGNAFFDIGLNNDQEVYCTIAALGAVGDVLALYARIQNPGEPDASAWIGQVTIRAGADEWQIFEMPNSTTFIQRGGTGLNDLAVGDGVGFSVIGTDIRLMQRSGGVWADRVTAVQSEQPMGSVIGLELQNTAWVVDDFGGGSFAPDEPGFSTTTGGTQVRSG
jgi:hypothetical protein